MKDTTSLLPYDLMNSNISRLFDVKSDLKDRMRFFKADSLKDIIYFYRALSHKQNNRGFFTFSGLDYLLPSLTRHVKDYADSFDYFKNNNLSKKYEADLLDKRDDFLRLDPASNNSFPFHIVEVNAKIKNIYSGFSLENNEELKGILPRKIELIDSTYAFQSVLLSDDFYQQKPQQESSIILNELELSDYKKLRHDETYTFFMQMAPKWNNGLDDYPLARILFFGKTPQHNYNSDFVPILENAIELYNALDH
ncbi:MAG: hypothetical protein ACQESC_00405 [Nanobdellota archaeon]